MQTSDLIVYLQDGISDTGEVVDLNELQRVTGQAVRAYSRLAPDIAEVALATTSGTTDYAVPSGVLRVLRVVDATGTAQDFTVFGQTLRLTTAADGSTYTMTVWRLHQADTNGDYPTIPDADLDYVGTLGIADVLTAIGADIARRADLKEGSSTEAWPRNARNLLRHAEYLRSRTADALGAVAPVVG